MILMVISGYLKSIRITFRQAQGERKKIKALTTVFANLAAQKTPYARRNYNVCLQTLSQGS